MRPSLAISLFVAGKRALVIGSGAMAAERAARLYEAGAVVDRVAEGALGDTRLDGAALVMVCDEAKDVALAERVRAAAHARGAMCYAQDRPDQSDFAMPALVRRGPVRVAISTEATAPALSRRLREELERLLDDRLGPFAEALEREREALTGDPTRAETLGQRVAGLRLEGRLVLPDPADAPKSPK